MEGQVYTIEHSIKDDDGDTKVHAEVNITIDHSKFTSVDEVSQFARELAMDLDCEIKGLVE